MTSIAEESERKKNPGIAAGARLYHLGGGK
jgi:hypothetical protein